MPKLTGSPVATSAGCVRIAAAATTNSTLVKTGAAQFFGLQVFNASAAVRYLKFYNKATAPTVGTDVPAFVVGIAPGGRADITLPTGIDFSLGLGYATTTLVADSDTTAVAANDIVGSISYF